MLTSSLHQGTYIAIRIAMTDQWPISPVLMVASFPLLCMILLGFVHAVVEFAPRTIRAHRVSYRRIQTRVADFLLILRLALQRE